MRFDEKSLFGTIFDEFSLFIVTRLGKSEMQNLSKYPGSDRKIEGRPQKSIF